MLKTENTKLKLEMEKVESRNLFQLSKFHIFCFLFSTFCFLNLSDSPRRIPAGNSVGYHLTRFGKGGQPEEPAAEEIDDHAGCQLDWPLRIKFGCRQNAWNTDLNCFFAPKAVWIGSVSYTHLTLPTIYSV